MTHKKIYKREAGGKVKSKKIPKPRTPSGRIHYTELGVIKNPKNQKKVLKLLLEGVPDEKSSARRVMGSDMRSRRIPSNKEIGQAVFKGTKYTEGTKLNYVKTIKTVLVEALRDEIGPGVTVNGVSKIKLVEGGPEIGREFAQRIVNLHELKERERADFDVAERVFNYRVKTPAPLHEIHNRVKDYIDWMKEHRGTPDKIKNLSKRDIIDTQERAIRARFGIDLGRSLSKLPEKDREFLKLYKRDPDAALKSVGMTRKFDRSAIINKINSFKVIPDHAQVLRGIHNVNGTQLRDTFVTQFIGKVEVPKRFFMDWSKKANRVDATLKAIDTKKGDWKKVGSADFSSGLMQKLKRERGFSHSESVAFLLHEAGAITSHQRKVRARSKNPFAIHRAILRRADPMLSIRSHRNNVHVLTENGLMQRFKLLEKSLESDFERYDRGKSTLGDISEKYGVGVRGVNRLYKNYKNKGEVTLRNKSPASNIVKNPPIQEDMLSVNDHLETIGEIVRNLDGVPTGKKSKLKRVRIMREPKLEKVHEISKDVLASTRENREPRSAIRKLQALNRAIKKVGDSPEDRMVHLFQEKDSSKISYSVNVDKLHNASKTLIEELKAQQKYKKKGK